MLVFFTFDPVSVAIYRNSSLSTQISFYLRGGKHINYISELKTFRIILLPLGLNIRHIRTSSPLEYSLRHLNPIQVISLKFFMTNIFIIYHAHLGHLHIIFLSCFLPKILYIILYQSCVLHAISITFSFI
jgi:hypothetical protein